MTRQNAVFVHICCGPCSIAVLEWLLKKGYAPTGFFFNPNIHPLSEYLRRQEGALAVASHFGIPLICADALPEEQQYYPAEPTPFSEGATPPASTEKDTDNTALYPVDHSLDGLAPAVDPVRWMRFMHGREYERCALCWSLRLHKTAQMAVDLGFSAFTSTLLYSRYQRHDVLREQGKALARANNLHFVYHDFREFWQRGIDRSKEMGIYRQQYCGCLYSEYARYRKSLHKG